MAWYAGSADGSHQRDGGEVSVAGEDHRSGLKDACDTDSKVFKDIRICGWRWGSWIAANQGAGDSVCGVAR